MRYFSVLKPDGAVEDLRDFGMIAPPRAVTVAHCFAAYGLQIGLRAGDADVVKAIGSRHFEARLPPGWRRESRQDLCEPAAWYDITSSDQTPSQYTLCAGTEIVAVDDDLIAVFRAFTSHSEFLIAQRAPEHLFVHAGVVGWRGKALLIPGRSFSGKTTLVRAFLEAGATYFSDEYAVLDRAGEVHPYSRPLAMRREPTEPMERVTAESLGAETGALALPVGFVLVTTYRPGVRWRPRPLTPSRTLLAMMENAVAARGSPNHSMPILQRAAAHARALAGPRGEAAALVSEFVRRVDQE